MAQGTYPLGLKFSDFEYSKVPKRYFSVRGTRSMPQSYSLKEYCPKPLSQLAFKSSAGWAAAYAALTIVKAEQNGWQGSEIMKNVYAPSYPVYMARQAKTLGINDELSLPNVIEALKEHGTPKYRQLPSRHIISVTDEIKEIAKENRISEYAKLYEKRDTKLKKLNAIKTTLNDKLPVLVSMHISKSFFYAKDFWQPREAFSKDLPGHALTIVGYDDTKYGGAFEVINSWGSEWGNGGFMWIRYDDFIEFNEEAYDIYVIPGKTSGVELGGAIDLTLVADKTPMDLVQLSPGYYKIAKSYPSGTEFTINIKNESPAFIYAFGSDLTGDIQPFFPPTFTSAALAKASSFYIPDSNTPVYIDDTIGTDYLCVLFSKEDLDMFWLFNLIKNSKGSFGDKVRTALKDKMISPAEINFNSSTAGFKLAESEKTVVMLIIEHEHN